MVSGQPLNPTGIAFFDVSCKGHGKKISGRLFFWGKPPPHAIWWIWFQGESFPESNFLNTTWEWICWPAKTWATSLDLDAGFQRVTGQNSFSWFFFRSDFRWLNWSLLFEWWDWIKYVGIGKACESQCVIGIMKAPEGNGDNHYSIDARDQKPKTCIIRQEKPRQFPNQRFMWATEGKRPVLE